MLAFGLLAVAASFYLVYVLELFKFRRIRERQMRTREEIEEEMETASSTRCGQRTWTCGEPLPTRKRARVRAVAFGSNAFTPLKVTSIWSRLTSATP